MAANYTPTYRLQTKVPVWNDTLLEGLNVSTTARSRIDPENETSFWVTLNREYGEVHGYLSVALCVFGIVANILNIIVLTRRHLYSPTNLILTALAIADMLTMFGYMCFAGYLFIITEPDCTHGYIHKQGWMIFITVCNCIFITSHCVAMWLTVALALFRYIFVCRHTIAPTMCSMERSKLTVFLVYLFSIIFCIPYYLSLSVTGYPTEDGQMCYEMANSELALRSTLYSIMVTWIFAVVNKIIPCIIMAWPSVMIVIAMQQAKRRRERLLNNASRVGDHSNSHEHDRTTYMLVAVVLSLFITEAPQGILAMFMGLDAEFQVNVYNNIGDLMDMLILTNSSLNFILYCAMSKQFRDTFKSLFVTKHVPQFLNRVKQQPNGADYSSMVKTTATTHV